MIAKARLQQTLRNLRQQKMGESSIPSLKLSSRQGILMTDRVEAPKAAPTGARVVGLDVARGALMAYIIVVIHGMFWLNLVPWDIASLFLFEMPLIFMISGAAVFLGERSNVNYFDFLARRAVRILVPYLAYALVAAAIMIALRYREAPLETLLAWLNPVNGGAGRSAPMLNWHLWFVAPFLVVMAAMPFLGPLAARARAPLWSQAIGATLLALAADMLDETRLGFVQTIVFYALWTGFGYALARNYARYKLLDYALMLALSAAALAALFMAFPGQFTFNMQTNKFPPNAIFFLFCCAWVAFFLIVTRAIPERFLEGAANSPILRPFISSGYSIYMWQGVGYWGAAQVGREFGLDKFAVWPLAIALSVLLGVIASPLERIRLPKAKARAAQPA